MKIPISYQLNIEELASMLEQAFSNYNVTLRSSLFGKYIEVKKSSIAGACIRIKTDHIRVDGAIPSTALRALFGGLLLLAIAYKGMKAVEKEVAAFLEDKLRYPR